MEVLKIIGALTRGMTSTIMNAVSGETGIKDYDEQIILTEDWSDMEVRFAIKMIQ